MKAGPDSDQASHRTDFLFYTVVETVTWSYVRFTDQAKTQFKLCIHLNVYYFCIINTVVCWFLTFSLSVELCHVCLSTLTFN